MVLFACYRYVIRSNTKITPTKPDAATTPVPPEKYQLAVFV
jgi:hypothetical protein